MEKTNSTILVKFQMILLRWKPGEREAITYESKGIVSREKPLRFDLHIFDVTIVPIIILSHVFSRFQVP